MASSAQTLARQFKEITKNGIPGFVISLKDENIYEWSVGIIGPPDTIYQGGYFLSSLNFPNDYPFMPPTFKFEIDFWHPNVYPDGRLCISILHPPGDDPVSGERAEERWNPTQSVESILLSIVSLLSDPNCSSPANVDAGVMYRDNYDEFKARTKAIVDKSKKSIPLGIKTKMESAYKVEQTVQEASPDEDFWNDDDESSFGHLTEDD